MFRQKGFLKPNRWWFLLGLAGLTGACNNGNQTTSSLAAACSTADLTAQYLVTESGQTLCFDANGLNITCPSSTGNYYGQDGNYTGRANHFGLCSNNQVTLDYNTGLMWEKAYHGQANYSTASAYCDGLDLGGYADWRLPGIKELVTLADFSGSVDDTSSTSPSNPYLDTQYFDIAYDTALSSLTGTHVVQMMGQTWSATVRPDLSTFNYFYNFLDGHLKSNLNSVTTATAMYRCVRGDSAGVTNSLTDNGDQTVSDSKTGLVWQKANATESTGDYQFTWTAAMNYCESLTLASHTDWRLPNVKELASILDYTNQSYSIDTTVFTSTYTTNTGPFFWTGTTDEEAPKYAYYVCFGHCWDYLLTSDVHGPGAIRSDPKYDNGNLPTSLGDQKDLVQANNYVRCVR